MTVRSVEFIIKFFNGLNDHSEPNDPNTINASLSKEQGKCQGIKKLKVGLN
jgi:hypothetical protein